MAAPGRDLLAPHSDPRTEAFLARLVNEAPPLTGADRDRIVRLLRGAERDRTPGETRTAA